MNAYDRDKVQAAYDITWWEKSIQKHTKFGYYKLTALIDTSNWTVEEPGDQVEAGELLRLLELLTSQVSLVLRLSPGTPGSSTDPSSSGSS